MFNDLRNFLAKSKAIFKNQTVLKLTDSNIAERTGLSLSQTRRAKVLLIKAGLIRVIIAKDSQYHQGKTVSHISVPDEVISLAKMITEGIVQICITGDVQNHISKFVQGCSLPLYVTEKNKNKEDYPHNKYLNEEIQNQIDFQTVKGIFG